MKPRILRWNRLKRRAAALGVDVQTLVKLDADALREPPSDDDDRQRKLLPLLPK